MLIGHNRWKYNDASRNVKFLHRFHPNPNIYTLYQCLIKIFDHCISNVNTLLLVLYYLLTIEENRKAPDHYLRHNNFPWTSLVYVTQQMLSYKEW